MIVVRGQEWDFVQINAGATPSGFFFNKSGLQYDNRDDYGFEGWLGEFNRILSPPFLLSLIIFLNLDPGVT